MNFTEYQINAVRTQPNGNLQALLSNFSMGLAGEAGETVDYLKKVVFHGHKMDYKHIEKELGDVMWYIANIADVLEIDLQEVAEMNIEKLKARYPDGFSEEKSVNRDES